jgi:hypothetical protein
MCLGLSTNISFKKIVVFFSESSLVPSLQVYFPEGSLQFEIVSNPKESQGEAEARRGHHSSSSSFQEARKKLLRVAMQRIDTQRKHHQLLRWCFYYHNSANIF